jgi:hypothetical protein
LAGAKDPAYRQMLEQQLEKHTGLKVRLAEQSATTSKVSAGTGISFYVGFKQNGGIPTENATLEFQGPQKAYAYVDANNQPTQPVNPAGSSWIYSQFQQSQGSGTYRVTAKVGSGVINAQTIIDVNNVLQPPDFFEAGASADGTIAANWNNLAQAKSYLAVLYDSTAKKTVWADISNKNFVEGLTELALDQTHTYDLTISAFNFDFNLNAKAPNPSGLETNVNSVIFRKQVSIGTPFLKVERKSKQLNDTETIRMVLSGEPNGEAKGSVELFNSAQGALRYSLELPADADVQLSSISGAIATSNLTPRIIEAKTMCRSTESERTVVGQLKTNAGNNPIRPVLIQIECVRAVTATETWKQVAGMGSVNEFILNLQGTMILAAGYEGIRVWEVATSKIVYARNFFSGGGISSLTWKPDGTQFAYRNTSKVTVVDLVSQNDVFSLDFSIVDRVIWSPIANKLFIAGYNIAKLVQADTGTDIVQFASWTGDISNITWSPDGTRVAATVFNNSLNSKTLTIWNASTGEVERRIDTDYFFRGLSWNNTSSQIAAGYRNQIRVWDVPTGQEQTGLTLTSQNTNDEVNMYGWDSVNQRFIVYFDSQLGTVNASTGVFINQFTSGGTPSISLLSNRIATARSELGLLTLRIYDLTTAALSASVESRSVTITNIVWNPSSAVFAVVGSQTARILNKTGDLQRELPIFNGFFWSRDGSQYATSNGSKLQFRDSISGNIISEIQLSGSANQVFWNSDSSLIAVQESLRIRVLNAVTGVEIWRLEDARSVAISPSRTRLLIRLGESISNVDLRLYNFNTGQMESSINTTGVVFFYSLNWGPDENRFITYGGFAGGVGRIFDLTNNTNYLAESGFSSKFQWSPDGKRIFVMSATAFANFTLSTVSPLTGEFSNSLVSLIGENGSAPEFAVSPDGTSLVSSFDNQ